jgi:AcrR family transcriptional regulator
MTQAASARRQRRTEITRGRLLDAALEVFCARGYDGASLSEVTDRADLGTGTLYLHFKDKRTLYEAMVRREAQDVRKRWLTGRVALGTSEADAVTEVRFLCEVILEWWARARPELTRLVLFDGPPVETWLVTDLERVITPVLEKHVASADLVAHLVIGALLSAGRFHANRKRPMSKERLTDLVVAFCAGGIAAEPKIPKAVSRRR